MEGKGEEGRGGEGRGGAPFNLSARGPNWLFGRHWYNVFELCEEARRSKVNSEDTTDSDGDTTDADGEDVVGNVSRPPSRIRHIHIIVRDRTKDWGGWRS
jgi:hypothetical protein